MSKSLGRLKRIFLPHICSLDGNYTYGKPPPVKRQRLEAQKSLLYNPNIENFDIELMHKRLNQQKYYQIKLTAKSNDVYL